MEPTLQNQDYILISKIARTLNQPPDYGEIVIIDSRVSRPRTWKDDLTDPMLTYLTAFSQELSADHTIWIKRVVGKPGDVLEFQKGRLLRNGQVLEEPYIKEAMKYTVGTKIIVPANHMFVLGDNRNNSSDSRIIGSVPLDHVLGNLAFKIW